MTGRLYALNEEAVPEILEAHAILADTISPEKAGGLFPPTLETALDEAGVRVTFSQMARVHEGHGVWILEHEKIHRRVMQLARETLGGAAAQQPALRRIEQLLVDFYGAKRAGPSTGIDLGRFANAEEVRSEVRRLMSAINKLERELVSIRSRPAADREPRRAATGRGSRDRTQDEVLREIFEHNLELMKLTSEQGNSAPPRP